MWEIKPAHVNHTRTPRVEAALAVTYLQFPIQVSFPYIGQPVTDTLVVLITVISCECHCLRHKKLQQMILI